MEILSQSQLETIAALFADETLSQEAREAKALEVAGSSILARRALDWLPEAFGLVAIAHIAKTIVMPTTFSAQRTDGTWQQIPFSAEPIFAQAMRLAFAASHSNSEIFRPLAERSSSLNVVDKALNAGEDLGGAVLSGPALIGIPAETYSA
jgi:hypothetical protein